MSLHQLAVSVLLVPEKTGNVSMKQWKNGSTINNSYEEK